MNSQTIRRAITLLALTVAATASLAAHASPPPLSPVFINGPGDGATVSYETQFDWTDTGADKYFLKFTIVETGETFKHTVSGVSCGVTDCEVAYENTPLFAAVHDGQTVQWRIVAKYETGKTKSAPRTLTADTVVEPSILLPATGSTLETGSEVVWDTHTANERYTLVVKRISTGERVVKYHVLDSACTFACALDPRALGEIVPGAQYRWFIKSKGLNGDIAKSAKQIFVTPFDIVG